jgi:PKD repeat protein
VARVAGLAQRRRRPPLASGNPANAALAADFSAGVLSGTRPFSVQFRDATSGEATAWLWDLGDGKSSTLQNPPQKVYRPTNSQIPAGQSSVQFTIRLTAFGPTGQNSVTTPVTVNVQRFSALFSPTNVFASCTGCHGSQGGCTLTPEQTAFDELTIEAAALTCTPGQPRAIPYNSPGSNLFQKVTSPVCGGAVMGGPVNGTLDAAQKDQIRRWIDTGALR